MNMKRSLFFRAGMVVFMLALLLGAMPTRHAQAAGEIIYGTVNDFSVMTSTLVTIDPDTGALISTIGPVGYFLNGLDYDPVSGLLYGSTSTQSPVFPNGLITINMTTGAGTPVGAGFGFGSVTNIRANPAGALFGWWDPAADDLVSINSTTGVATLVGESGISTGIYGMSFDASGVLYFINVGGSIYTINTTTGAATDTGISVAGGGDAHHGDFRPSTGMYVGIDSNSTRGAPPQPKNLRVINVSTGAVVATLPTVNGLHTLTFAPPAASAPVLLDLAPKSGPITGGTTVIINGTNLTGGIFTFGGVAAVCSISPDGTQAICTTPPHAAGAVDVRITKGSDTTTIVGGFTYETVIIPGTGFAPNRVSVLSAQTTSYAALGDLWLEIPSLGVNAAIVGVPQSSGTWDTSWLGKDAGWLNGSAFPTLAGNSVLTGHVYDAFGKPGPFAGINRLWYGSQIIVHAWGGEYIYEVRSVMQVDPTNSTAMMKHQDLPWLTLVTCRGYNADSDSYKYRILVRAVLVDVK
jgi:LPXTG-site transpeptidase (sortase) family protein